MKKRCLSMVLVIALVMTMVTSTAGISYAGTDPSLSITSALLNKPSQYRIGDAAVLRYTVTPSGGVQEVNRSAVDTVLVLDVSNSMSGTKLATLKSSAKAFVQHMKDNGVTGDKITLISFHTYATQGSTYSYPSFGDINSAIDRLTISGNSGNNGGTNYEDALMDAKAYFKKVSLANSVVFFSDGVPTFYNNDRGSLGGTGYEDSYNNPELERCKAESIQAATSLKSSATVYTISLGTNQKQHDVMKSIATDDSSALISPGTAELTGAFKKIAGKVTAKEITDIKVRGAVPTGLTLNESSLLPGYSLTWINSETFEISVPSVTFPEDGTTPAPFYFDVSFTVNSEGNKWLGEGSLKYIDTKNGSKTQNIAGLQLNVSAVENLSITITSALSNNQENYKVGDSGSLKYTVTPAGGVKGVNRPPIDTVLVLDVSNSMAGAKLEVLKSSAKAFVQHMKTSGVSGDQITLIDFHTYSAQETTYAYPSFSGLEAAIDSLTATGYEGIDGGTNYEDALLTAKMHFQNASDSQSIVFFSDGVPTYYDGNDRYGSDWVWDVNQGNWVYQLVRRSNQQIDIEGPGNKSSWNTVNQAQAVADQLKALAQIYTISLGSDQAQHNVMKNIASDTSSALISPGTTELTAAFKKIAEKVTAKEFTNIKIRGSVPSGLTIKASSLPAGYSLTWVDGGTSIYEISVPNVTFPADGSTPGAFSFDLPFTVSSEGTKDLGKGMASYTNSQNGNGSQDIPGVTIYVYFVSAPIITPSTKAFTNENVKVTVTYPGTTTEKYYKVVAKNENPDNVEYTKITSEPITLTIVNNETTIYAYSMNKTYKSPVSSYKVDNIDRVPPAKPIIGEGTPSFNGSAMSVDITILYSADSEIREYRIGESGNWIPYTDKIPVTKNGTIIQARARDAVGNFSEIAEHTVNQLIHSVTQSSIASLTNTNRVLTVQTGSFISILKFQTDETVTSQVQMILSMDKNSSLFNKMVLPTSVKAIDNHGNTVTFNVSKDTDTGKIIFTSASGIGAGQKSFTLKLLVKVNKANISSYSIKIDGSKAPALIVDVVKNPPIK